MRCLFIYPPIVVIDDFICWSFKVNKSPIKGCFDLILYNINLFEAISLQAMNIPGDAWSRELISRRNH